MDVPLECLSTERMASGNDSLLLTRSVPWESFAVYAARVVELLGAVVLERADGPVQRIWTVEIGGSRFWLAYDDYAGDAVSMDPQSRSGAVLIPQLRQALLAARAAAAG